MTASPLIVGITGGSASGKSAFLKQLKDSLKGEMVIVSQDNYYYKRDLQPLDEKGIPNFDTPQSIDIKTFFSDVKALTEGKPFSRNEYTYNNPLATPKTIQYHPASLILIEGLFLLNNSEIRSILNLAVYIESEEHLKVIRRIIRDEKERGYDLDDVLYRYEHHVYPCYENHIKPFRKYADIIIPNYQDFSKSLEVVKAYIENKLR